MSYIIKKRKKDTAWRKFTLKNLAGEVILYDKVVTSFSLAQGLTKLLAKLITYAKQDTLHSRRLALRYLVNRKHLGILDILFGNLKSRYQKRQGGYSRITKICHRRGDNNLRVEVALV